SASERAARNGLRGRGTPSEAPHVLGDLADLVFGQHRTEAGHPAGALALRAVAGTVGRPARDELDHVGLVREVLVGRASGEVPAERTLARLARVAPAPAGRVAAGAAVGAARRAQVVERLAPRGVQPVGDG